MSIQALRDCIECYDGDFAISVDEARAAVAEYDARASQHRASNQEVLDAVNKIAGPFMAGQVDAAIERCAEVIATGEVQAAASRRNGVVVESMEWSTIYVCAETIRALKEGQP